MTIQTLFPYQEEGAKWLHPRKTALLADEMGLGKTAQAIVAADLAGLDRLLVLCPAVARFNWAREFDKFSPRKRRCTVVTSRTDAPRTDTVICSYDLAMPSLLSSWAQSGAPYGLVLDEAHYLKNPGAKRTQRVFGTEAGLVRNASRVWALTGTPAPNNASELWPLLRVFGVYGGSLEAFIREFCTGYESPYGFRITGTKNVPKLRAMLAKIMLRRKKVDVLKDLPPIRYSDFVVEPTPLTDVEYEMFFPKHINDAGGAKAGALAVISEEQKILDAIVDISIHDTHSPNRDKLVVLEGIAESVSTLRRHVGLLKAKTMVPLIAEELDADPAKKLVLFCVHRDVIALLRDALVDYNPVTIFGGTPPAKRDRHIARFQGNHKCRVFIGQVDACGVAINLTASSDVIFVEASWTPASNAQAAMRVHRIGQTKPVLVRFFSLVDSYDERVQELLRRKTADLARLFD